MTDTMCDAPARSPLDQLDWFMLGLCASIIVLAVGLHIGTGMRVFTRYPDTDIQRADATARTAALEELLADAGLDDEHGPMASLENKFAFGLLPSGTGRALASVATIAVPLVLLAPIAIITRRRLRPVLHRQESESIDDARSTAA